MTLGALAVVEAAPNSRIQLDGGDVEILGSDARLLAGLENVSLLVTGGEIVVDLGGRQCRLGRRPR